MIKSKSETHGGCRHQTSLHWFNKGSPTEHSTDDVVMTERVTGTERIYGSSNWWVHVPPVEGVIVCPQVSNGATILEV